MVLCTLARDEARCEEHTLPTSCAATQESIEACNQCSALCQRCVRALAAGAGLHRCMKASTCANAGAAANATALASCCSGQAKGNLNAARDLATAVYKDLCARHSSTLRQPRRIQRLGARAGRK